MVFKIFGPFCFSFLFQDFFEMNYEQKVEVIFQLIIENNYIFNHTIIFIFIINTIMPRKYKNKLRKLKILYN